MESDTFMFTTEQPPPPPPIPPDQQRPTFKDKVLGKGPAKRREPRQFQNLVTSGVLSKENVNGDRLFPSFDFVEEAEYEKICQPWQGCLVVKRLGRHIGYTALCEKLRSLWKPVGGLEVTDIHHGYFQVKFDVEADRETAMTGAPWLVYDHYLSVKPWTKDFVAADEKINTTMVWIRIPGLGMQFYDEDILMTLATGVGTPIKLDMTTADRRLGKFARICVEIDLDKPVVGMLRLRGTWYNIEYEGLHLLCSKCGCYGHLSRKCKVVVATPATMENATASQEAAATPKSTPLEKTLDPGVNHAFNAEPMHAESSATKSAVTVPDAAHGKWLNVEKPKRKQNNNRQSGTAKSKEPSNGNRFQSLTSLSEEATNPVKVGTNANNSGNRNVVSKVVVNAKKRSRRDDGKSSQIVTQGPLQILGKPQDQSLGVSTREKASGSTSGQLPTKMIGDKVVYDLGGGAMSTEYMQPAGGSRYQLMDMGVTTNQRVNEGNTATNPSDPGPKAKMMMVHQQ
ncbi:uncharacterized protein LOC130743491 [Lotus japonicus]|uniref:uncharacterized protein LOC130743491 n=1 Tax=Lotus japonicus TaxID=34305 RepID=UPI00258F36A7|nr:uncharacterized protein LOC130743491 [Lotus japonicus]